MGKRGRPRHPDILTPREWEVLDLVRDGLTNEQIAEQLGISRDGVKYHVSEILSKLGLGSREEAAAWRPEGRPWWAAGLSFLGWPLRQLSLPAAAKVAGAAAVVAAVSGVGLLVWGVIATGGPDEESTPVGLAGLTVEETYDRIAEGLRRPGFVLHSIIEAQVPDEDGALRPAYRRELWIDADRNAARDELFVAPGWAQDTFDEHEVSVLVDRYIYLPDDPGEALRFEVEWLCPGTENVIISALLDCGGFTTGAGFFIGDPAEIWAARVEPDARHEGQRVVALAFEEQRPEQEPAAVILVYFDPESFLPLARGIEYRQDGQVYEEVVSEYEHEFVAVESLAADFLDPRSIGYGAENEDALLDEIAEDVPVYWLGSEFEPAGGFDPLVLVRMPPRGERGPNDPGMSGWLIYDTPRGLSGVHILLWRPGDWEAFLQSEFGNYLADPRCGQRSEMEVGGRRAVVYALPELRYPLSAAFLTGPCAGRVSYPTLTDTTFIMVIDFGDVIVDMRPDPTGDYRSLEALEAVVEGLRRR